ncbi:baseplate J/gp47 family protein [Pseudomonas sp. SLFW]|uniref:baseplate assembly protein n=1 Tax=Pseudomonas sp. SLFW TaxID=2683259 RepID=UPI00141241CA|nr:baseplate J/gp47 family protein [Pseudomonas sp. SLFW]NBB09353.1 baseplate protein [Pseudomonas sp. SLFW]
MRALPPPEFVKIDPAAIEASLIARYEKKANKTLYPAQVERLFIDQIAYAKTLTLMAIQQAGERLLVRHSGGPILDYLGELVSTARLLAQPARCTQVFRLPEPATEPFLISAGARVTSQDGRIAFMTEQPLSLEIGMQEARVVVVCDQVGEVGNGWAIGQISSYPGQAPAGMTTFNETVPEGGIDDEQDPAYIERIILSPESFSTAGPEGSYVYHARAAHQSITDVAVRGGEEDPDIPDGEVWIYPLTHTGLPTPELLALAQSSASARKKRPLTDHVLAKSPVEVPFKLRGRLTLFNNVDKDSVLALARKAAKRYADERRATLGNDIVPEQIIRAVQVNGVYQLRLIEPAMQVLARHEWANCTEIDLDVEGFAHG